MNALSSLVCCMYNRRLYEQAFTLIEIVCRDLCKKFPCSLSADKVNSSDVIGFNGLLCYMNSVFWSRFLCNFLICVVTNQLNRPFMLAVQTSRRAGRLKRALDWIILWLKALGDQMTTHMAEPVSLWVKTKSDGARNDDEDIRLR